jgi:hypothetical protein
MTGEPCENSVSPERRRKPRSSFAVLCEVRQGDSAWLSTSLRNLSAHGFQVEWFVGCRLDLRLWVRLPGCPPVPAHARWKRGSIMGCEFTRPLEHELIDRLLHQHQTTQET